MRRWCVLRYGFCRWIEQDGIDIGQFAKHPQEAREFRSGTASHGSCEQFVLYGRVWFGFENPRYKLPGTRGRKCVRVAIECVQQLRPETKKRDDLRADSGLDRPLRPFLGVHLEVQVNEAI